MKFTVDKRDKFCVFKLDEDKLNSLNSPKMKSELVLINAEGFSNIILDLSDVTFVDSSGLSAILVGNRLCKEANGTFAICGANQNVSKLIKISQLQTILNVIPTLPEAIDFVMMEELERDLRGDD